MVSKTRKVFLNELPVWKSGTNKGKTNWNNSVGRKVKFIYEDIIGEVEIVDYVKNYLQIKYQDKDIFRISTDNFKVCRLGKMLGKITNEFKIEIGTHFKDNNRNLIITDRKYMYVENEKVHRKVYKYICKECGYDCREYYINGEYKAEGFIDERSLFRGRGCSCCAGKFVAEGVNDISTTDPWMVKFFQNPEDAKKYTRNSNQEIFAICPDCGQIKTKKISISTIRREKTIGCGKCSDGVSYPNKFMFKVLEQLNVLFQTEYSPKWISPKRYDFYFELHGNKYIVEMDGGWHNNHNNLSGKTKKESKEDDKYKDEKAKENNVFIIRIDSAQSELEYIKNNVINSELNNIFDLSIIDWARVEEGALGSLAKRVCEIKRHNPNITNTEIGKTLHIHPYTVRRYLKKGSEIWDWVDYNPKEKAMISNNGFSKKVEVFRDGVSLGVFPSINEVERISKNTFNTILFRQQISLCCCNKKPKYKGFVFRHIQ